MTQERANNFISRCGWFTFFTNKRLCQLLSRCTSLELSPCSTCLGGPFGCKVATQQDCKIGQCQGDLIQSDWVATMEECHLLCKSTLGCEWVTFNQEPEPFCLLFRNCPTLDESCPNCISGVLNCKLGEAH